MEVGCSMLYGYCSKSLNRVLNIRDRSILERGVLVLVAELPCVISSHPDVTLHCDVELQLTPLFNLAVAESTTFDPVLKIFYFSALFCLKEVETRTIIVYIIGGVFLHKAYLTITMLIYIYIYAFPLAYFLAVYISQIGGFIYLTVADIILCLN